MQTYRLNIVALCLSCFFAKYKSLRNSVKNSKQKSITNSSSMMTNKTKPKLCTSSHQLAGRRPVTVYTSGPATAYRIGKNQLKAIAPRIPPAK